ncbi:MAG: ABC transporter ATP-binding protein [Clostridia bacterium]|nr:ABC transporter ATP-binding protein [Clostridia bacterium]
MIELKKVTKRYRRGAAALKDISFTVGDGGLAVLGDKGAGKTTLAKLLCGTVASDSGTTTVDGQSLASREASGLIGYMPEKSSLSPSLTVTETLGFFAKLRGLESDAVGAALEEAEVPEEIASAPVGALTYGAVKRASLALALLGSPKYLVLDQPLLGLDEDAEAEMLTLLRGLAEKYTLVYFSDTVDDARELCVGVLLLSAGKAVAYGSFESVVSPEAEHPEYKLRARGDAEALRSALNESEAVVRYQVSVTASGTSLIEVTLNSTENAEGVIRELMTGAGQKLIEIKKADSPVERVLSRLYDIQDAKEEEYRRRRSEKAEPVKVTEALLTEAFTERVDEEDGAGENGENNAKDTVNPRENGETAFSGTVKFHMLSDDDDKKDEDEEDDGGSTLF